MNLEVFNSREIVAHYAGLEGLTSCETALVQRHLRPGTDILDLGVGGGRTTTPLMSLARRYVGVENAPEMIEACRARFPAAEFDVDDAAKLDRFEDDSFDAVVFSFNGIDCLHPDRARHECVRASARVLRPGGVFIFSSHSPRRVVTFADTRGVTGWRALRRHAKAVFLSLVRLIRAARGPWWTGEGYVLNPEHGGLLTHVSTPRRVRRELEAHGFQHLQTLPSTFPRHHPGLMVPWYYYAFRRRGLPGRARTPAGERVDAGEARR